MTEEQEGAAVECSTCHQPVEGKPFVMCLRCRGVILKDRQAMMQRLDLAAQWVRAFNASNKKLKEENGRLKEELALLRAKSTAGVKTVRAKKRRSVGVRRARR